MKKNPYFYRENISSDTPAHSLDHPYYGHIINTERALNF
jgi:hypothetical protein